jgi:hypothetical protein
VSSLAAPAWAKLGGTVRRMKFQSIKT